MGIDRLNFCIRVLYIRGMSVPLTLRRQLLHTGMLCTAVLSCLAFVSCDTKIDFTPEIKRIDSLLTITSANNKPLVLPDSGALNDTILLHVNYIQQNYRGTMNRQMAETLREYRNIGRVLPVIAANDTQLRNGIEATDRQLTGLRTALLDGATHDAAGNPIDKNYVQKLLLSEEQKINSIKVKIEKNNSFLNTFDQRYLILDSLMTHWVDSIPPKKRTK